MSIKKNENKKTNTKSNRALSEIVKVVGLSATLKTQKHLSAKTTSVYKNNKTKKTFLQGTKKKAKNQLKSKIIQWSPQLKALLLYAEKLKNLKVAGPVRKWEKRSKRALLLHGISKDTEVNRAKFFSTCFVPKSKRKILAIFDAVQRHKLEQRVYVLNRTRNDAAALHSFYRDAKAAIFNTSIIQNLNYKNPVYFRELLTRLRVQSKNFRKSTRCVSKKHAKAYAIVRKYNKFLKKLESNRKRWPWGTKAAKVNRKLKLKRWKKIIYRGKLKKLTAPMPPLPIQGRKSAFSNILPPKGLLQNSLYATVLRAAPTELFFSQKRNYVYYHHKKAFKKPYSRLFTKREPFKFNYKGHRELLIEKYLSKFRKEIKYSAATKTLISEFFDFISMPPRENKLILPHKLKKLFKNKNNVDSIKAKLLLSELLNKKRSLGIKSLQLRNYRILCLISKARLGKPFNMLYKKVRTRTHQLSTRKMQTLFYKNTERKISLRAAQYRFEKNLNRSSSANKQSLLVPNFVGAPTNCFFYPLSGQVNTLQNDKTRNSQLLNKNYIGSLVQKLARVGKNNSKQLTSHAGSSQKKINKLVSTPMTKLLLRTKKNLQKVIVKPKNATFTKTNFIKLFINSLGLPRTTKLSYRRLLTSYTNGINKFVALKYVANSKWRKNLLKKSRNWADNTASARERLFSKTVQILKKRQLITRAKFAQKRLKKARTRNIKRKKLPRWKTRQRARRTAPSRLTAFDLKRIKLQKIKTAKKAFLDISRKVAPFLSSKTRTNKFSFFKNNASLRHSKRFTQFAARVLQAQRKNVKKMALFKLYKLLLNKAKHKLLKASKRSAFIDQKNLLIKRAHPPVNKLIVSTKFSNLMQLQLVNALHILNARRSNQLARFVQAKGLKTLRQRNKNFNNALRYPKTITLTNKATTLMRNEAVTNTYANKLLKKMEIKKLASSVKAKNLAKQTRLRQHYFLKLRRTRDYKIINPAVYVLGQRRSWLPYKVYKRLRATKKKARETRTRRSIGARRFIFSLNSVAQRYLALKQKMKTRFLKNLPRYAPAYNLLHRRWHSRRDIHGFALPRVWPSISEVRLRERINAKRYRLKQRLKKWPDPVFQEVETETGSPATIGYRRLRRTLYNNFNTNRWWKVKPTAQPFWQPLSVLALENRSKKRYGISANPKPIRKVPNWRAYRARRHIWERNSWRTLNNLFSNTTLQPDAWSTEKRILAVTAAENEFSKAVWKKCISLVGGSSTAQLKNYFISNSKNWLVERHFERSLYDALSVLRNYKHASTKVLKIVFLNRQQLFQRFPNWWQDEAKRRLDSVSEALLLFEKNKNSKKTLLTLIKEQTAGASACTELEVSMEERNLLAVSLVKLPNHVREKYFNDYIFQLEKKLIFTDKNMAACYQKWIHGIERHFKKTNNMKSSQTHEESEKLAVTDLGTERTRFPAMFVKGTDYDSLINSFYKKTVASRFRRVKSARFINKRPAAIGSFYEKAPFYQSTRYLRHARSFAQTTKRHSHLSRTYRRLLNKKNTQALLTQRTRTAPAKRRFFSKPHAVRFDLIANKNNVTTTRTYLAESLLKAAIQKRRIEKGYQDLRVEVRRRFLPVEQILPPWRLARKLRYRVRDIDTFGRYAYAKNTRDSRYSVAAAPFWTTSFLSMLVPENREPKTLTVLSTAELLTMPHVRIVNKKIVKNLSKSDSWRKKKSEFNSKTWWRQPITKKTRKWKKTPRNTNRRSRLYKDMRFVKKHRHTAIARTTKHYTNYKALQRHVRAASRFNYRFIDMNKPISTLTPLQFLNKTKKIVITDEQKKQIAIKREEVRRERFRYMAQLTETFTAYFPKLVSLVVERQMQNKVVTEKTLRGLIHAVYWSLRFYLQRDYGGTRLAGRDKKKVQFHTLYEEIFTDNLNRSFDKHDENTLRYRLQPHFLNKKKPLSRGAGDWLRQFFPRFRALVLEDDEAYEKLSLTSTQALRSHPSRKNPGFWETRNISGTMENRFRRLTNLRDRQNSSRFESMLMTTRRSPITVGHGAAAEMRAVSSLGSLAPKTYFFRRNFSTRINLSNENESFLISDRSAGSVPAPVDSTFSKETSLHFENKDVLIHNRASYTKRLYVDNNEEALVSIADLAAAQTTMKTRAVNTVKSNFIFEEYTPGLGALDVRLIRAKSPRNLQFVQRLPKKAITIHIRKKAETIVSTKLKNYYNLNSPKFYKTARKSIISFLPSKSTSAFNTVNTFRTQTAFRRVGTFLNTRKQCAAENASKSEYRYRTFYKNNNLQKQNIKKAQILDKNFVNNARSVLQFRKAKDTTKHLMRRKDFVLLPHSVVLQKIDAEFAKSRGVVSFITKNRAQMLVKKKRLYYASRDRLAVRLANRHRNLKKINFPRAKISVRTARYLKLNSAFSNLNVFSTRAFFKNKSRQNLYSTRAAFQYNANKKLKIRKAISEHLMNREEFAVENPGAEKRRELWGQLTLRWMKKARILKTWLKTSRRGLKKRKWKPMPTLLFNDMRSRLRKLEWREPDEHFFRRGWRFAFKFYPNERHRAPWLEKLMYRRALYHTVRGNYRRYQIPREQKRLKWLQYYRKAICSRRNKSQYIKRRRWPRLRIYNRRLFRSLFNFRNTRVAQKHFKKSSRRNAKNNGFGKSLDGLGNRLDVNLILLNIAPTVFWARVMSSFGLFRVNGKVVTSPTFRFQKGDRILWNHVLIERMREYFKPLLRKYDKEPTQTSLSLPKNFDYHPGIRTAIYRGLPKEEDLPKNSRLNVFLFKMFRAESGVGR